MTLGCQHLRQAPGGHILHHQQRTTLVEGDVVHGNDVRVLQPRGDAPLPQPPLPRVLGTSRVHTRGQHQLLDRDRAAQHPILGPPDHTHCAAAQPPPQLVTAREHLTRPGSPDPVAAHGSPGKATRHPAPNNPGQAAALQDLSHSSREGNAQLHDR